MFSNWFNLVGIYTNFWNIAIVKARSEQAITSKNDLQLRTNITKTNYQLLNKLGVLEPV
ncbi:hypothetical protein SHM_22370 [Spiroplasma ixodetis]|uniref:Uncharacterized protein n=1 Tax=Spiroplasma ixodetis TaxID=2141 RepID=A0ABM8BXI1_9MOLU|nr:hypothetical protein SHM_22370 [Spiroplasma ixodetis]